MYYKIKKKKNRSKKKGFVLLLFFFQFFFTLCHDYLCLCRFSLLPVHCKSVPTYALKHSVDINLPLFLTYSESQQYLGIFNKNVCQKVGREVQLLKVGHGAFFNMRLLHLCKIIYKKVFGCRNILKVPAYPAYTLIDQPFTNNHIVS